MLNFLQTFIVQYTSHLSKCLCDGKVQMKTKQMSNEKTKETDKFFITSIICSYPISDSYTFSAMYLRLQFEYSVDMWRKAWEIERPVYN